jgi:hypothetical protein
MNSWRSPGESPTDPLRGAWSSAQLRQNLDAGPVVINAIVYAEIAFAWERIATMDELPPAHLYRCEAIPKQASFPGLELIQPHPGAAQG